MEEVTITTRACRALREWDVNTGPKLVALAEGILSDVDDIDLTDAYPEDACTEIADQSVPIYTHEIMETIAEDVGLMASEPECGPAFDGKPTPANLAAANLYELASNIAHAALRERQEEGEYKEAELEEARDLGRAAGEMAGSWAADGNTEPTAIPAVLKMLEEGDPAAQNYLPRRPNLSGEFADDPTPLSIAEQVIEDLDETDLELLQEVAEAWEEGVDETFEDSCVKTLRGFLPEGEK